MQKQPEKDPSRFNLFVKLKPGIISPWPKQRRVWCYVGNKYVDEDYKQLRGLIKLMAKAINDYEIVELYDMKYTKDDQRRYIFTINKEGEIINHLQPYSGYLVDFVIPNFIITTM